MAKAKSKKPKTTPCTKWMRHKWEDIPGSEILGEDMLSQEIEQVCVFCKETRKIPCCEFLDGEE